jgi:hypothetical protein
LNFAFCKVLIIISFSVLPVWTLRKLSVSLLSDLF